MPNFRGGFSIRGKTITTSTGSISGTVVDGSSNPIANCVIELYIGSSLITSATTNGSGAYTFPSLTPASYILQQQPPLAYSIGPAEPDTYTLALGSGQNLTQNFVVQAAIGSDNFQSYSTNGQLQNTTIPIPVGDFWHGVTNGGLQATANVAQIILDTTGGPSGDKAMRYDMPARAGLSSAYALYLGPNVIPTPAGLTKIAFRWLDQYSSGFVNGLSTITGSAREYKMLLLQIGPPQGSNGVPQVGVYMEQNDDTSPIYVTMDTTDRNGNSINNTHAIKYQLPSNWRGSYHSWVINCTGLGSSNATFDLYYDETKIISLTGAFLPSAGSLDGTGTLIFPNLGEQINNGPDLAQSRWWREVGVYKTRPSLRAGALA